MENYNRSTVLDHDPSELIVDEEFARLIPAQSDAELAWLEADILRDGVRKPLDVWNSPDGLILLDGHTRFSIAKRYKLPFRVDVIDLPDRPAATAWILVTQLARRNLTAFQRAGLALKLKPLIAEKAKKNQREAGKNKLPQKSAEAVETRVELAKIAGVSHDTIHKVRVIADKAPEEVKEQLRKGATSINAEYAKLRQRKPKEGPPTPKPPSTKTLIRAYALVVELQRLCSEVCEAREKFSELVALLSCQGKRLDE